VASEVEDGLSTLAVDLAHVRVAERGQQVAVPREAVLDRADDEVDVVDAAALHA
jgi:hypothetical protein